MARKAAFSLKKILIVSAKSPVSLTFTYVSTISWANLSASVSRIPAFSRSIPAGGCSGVIAHLIGVIRKVSAMDLAVA